MKKISLLVLITIAAFTVIRLTFIQYKVQASGVTVTPVTFEVVHHIKNFLQDQPSVRDLREIHAIRSDTSTSRVEYAEGRTTRLLDRADGLRGKFTSETKEKSTSQLPSATIISRHDYIRGKIEHNCLASREQKYLREEYVQGVKLIVVSSGTGQGRGFTFWRAPNHGCIEMQQLYTEYDASGKKLLRETFMQLVSVKWGDPDSALFDNSSDYKEATPLAALKNH